MRRGERRPADGLFEDGVLPLHDLVELDDGTLVVAGYRFLDQGTGPRLLRSTDGGATWVEAELDPDPSAGPVGQQEARALVPLPGGSLLAVGRGEHDDDLSPEPGAWLSTDRGSTWAPVHPPLDQIDQDVDGGRPFRAGFSDGIVLGDGSVLLAAILSITAHGSGGERGEDVAFWRLRLTDA